MSSNENAQIYRLSWQLTGVTTCPVLYLFIGHFMLNCHDAAKFGTPTDKQ